MLRYFSLQNFRSFNAEQVLDLTERGGERDLNAGNSGVLKSLVLFGANGSGKSGLVTALKTFQDLVLHSHTFFHKQLSSIYTLFRLGADNMQSTFFGVDLTTEGLRYKYGVAYDAREIRWERLLVYQTGKAQRWFERRTVRPGGAAEWAPFSSYFHGPREAWRRATPPSSLFLSSAVALDCAQLRPLFNWFSELQVRSSSLDSAQDQIATVIGDDEKKRLLLRALRALDLYIGDIRIVERHNIHTQPRPTPSTSLGRSYANAQFELFHLPRGGVGVWVPAERESAGARSLVAFLSMLIHRRGRRGPLVVDDFGKRWHPSVARAVVRLLTHLDAGPLQYIATTHEVALMDLDI